MTTLDDVTIEEVKESIAKDAGDTELPPLPETKDSAPDWAEIPDALEIPKGRSVGFMRFKSEWTDAKIGDRNIVLWNLTEGEERTAIKRARGNQDQYLSEMAKQMIRSIDGLKANWTKNGAPGDVDKFFTDIGSKCRKQIQNYYLKTHIMNQEEQADFFYNCFAIRTATPTIG